MLAIIFMIYEYCKNRPDANILLSNRSKLYLNIKDKYIYGNFFSQMILLALSTVYILNSYEIII